MRGGSPRGGVLYTEVLGDSMVDNVSVDRAVLDDFLMTLHPESGDQHGHVIGLCIEDASSHMEQVRQACQVGAFEELKRRVTNLGAVGSMIGARRLFALCKAVEELVRTDCLSGAAKLVSSLERELSAVKQQLRVLFRGLNEGVDP